MSGWRLCKHAAHHYENQLDALLFICSEQIIICTTK